MKKMLFFAMMAVVAAVMSSCVHKNPVVNAETLKVKGKDPFNVPVNADVPLYLVIMPEKYNGETRFEVSDTSMVKILDHTRRACLLRGLKYGYCQLKVTCNDSLSITITLKVGLYKYTDVEFSDVFLMQPYDGMLERSYT